MAFRGASAEQLIAAEAIQTCQTCAVDKADVGVKAPILRSWRQACRITCPVCRSHLAAIGQGSVTNSEDDPRSLASWEEVLEGERLLNDFVSGSVDVGVPIGFAQAPVDPARSQTDRSKRWIETSKVLDLIIPGLDRLVAATGTIIPSADRPILPLSLITLHWYRFVERSGPKIIAELHGRTIGAYHAHLGTIARLDPHRHSTQFLEFSFMQHI